MESIKTCNVCYLSYDTKDHAPRVLSCGHTMCTKCLTNIINNPALRKCPFDNNVFAPSQNSIASFALNFIVIDMLEQKNNNTCKIHPGESLKLICLSDKTKICSECAKNEEHQGHKVKKIKALKAQGAKVKEELQETLLNVKTYEQEKAEVFEHIKKVFISTIGEKVKELKSILTEKEFEWVQQVNSIFDADEKNDTEGTFAFKQQIDEIIKDITHACQDENGDMMILDQEVNKNSQNPANRQTQFLKERSSRIQNKVLEMQKSLKQALVNSKATINSLQLSTQDVAKEIYSLQEEKEQLSQEEFIKRHKELRALKFLSHFDIKSASGCLEIFANRPKPKEVEINLDDFQATEKIDIQLARNDTLIEDPSPSVLSYIFHGLKNLADLTVSFSPLNFSNKSLWWLGNLIRNHIQQLRVISLSLTTCKFDDDSVPILCDLILSQTINLQSFCLDLDSCQVLDADLKVLAKSLKPFHKNLEFFAIGLRNNDITSHGVYEIFKLIQSMQVLKELQLDLCDLKISNESFKIFAENILPRLQALHSLTLLLNGSTISDECIDLILKNLPNLKGLNIDLDGTLLTDKTVEMFIEEVLPRLETLEYLSFTAEGTKISIENIEKIQKISESLEKKRTKAGNES